MGFVDNKKKNPDILNVVNQHCWSMICALVVMQLCKRTKQTPSGNFSRNVLGVNFDRVTLNNLSTRI